MVPIRIPKEPNTSAKPLPSGGAKKLGRKTKTCSFLGPHPEILHTPKKTNKNIFSVYMEALMYVEVCAQNNPTKKNQMDFLIWQDKDI